MFGQKTQPEWFFDSSIHLEAVSRLLYLVENREPLGLIQGSDGSGRSRVLSRLREELSRTGTMSISINLSGMDDESALWQVAESLGTRPRTSMRRHEVLGLIRDELNGRARCGVQTILLLDDYHRAVGDLSVFMRVLIAFSTQCQNMLCSVVASDKPLAGELSSYSLVPIRLQELDSVESSDFVRSLISQQSVLPSNVDESAVRAISKTSIGNAAKMSRICALLRVVQEASPGTRVTEETIYSLLSEFSYDNTISPNVMRAS